MGDHSREGTNSMRNTDHDIEAALRGERLHGDDFELGELERWYEDERAAYFQLSGADQGTTSAYPYHGLNIEHCYRHLPSSSQLDVLGFGSAHGHELLPIIDRCRSVTIVESAPGFAQEKLGNVPVSYVEPRVDGTLPFPAASFDVVTCFGVLHHVANVSFVVSEFYRCLRPGGYALIREPSVSMGDWRHPRPGLTKRERGIPVRIFRNIVETAGFEIEVEQRCVFSLSSKLGALLRAPLFGSRQFCRIDGLISSLPFWSNRYHATQRRQKVRPTAIAYVLRR